MGANVSFHNVKSLRLDPVVRNEQNGRVWFSRSLWLDYEDGTGDIVFIHGATAEALTTAGEPAPEEGKPEVNVVGVVTCPVVKGLEPPRVEKPPFQPGQEVECVELLGCEPPLTQGKRYFVNRVYKNHDGDEWFVGLGCDVKNGWFAWRFKAVADLHAKMVDPLYIPTLPQALADPAGFVAGMEEVGGES